ncbi:MAG: Crp/Fnr family transcriptional regulator [Nitrospiraceae bacterium]|nr:Crp/Fnr family transcriptional regulator [Nitrospiraceae bacterium]
MATAMQERFLGAFPVFRSASGDMVTDFLAAARHDSFPADLTMYTEGDFCPSIAFLLSGELRVFKAGEAGREITLYDIHAGETCILNASCILSGLPYPAHAVSTVGGELLLVPAGEFRRLIAAHAEMRDFVFRILSQRLSSVMTLIEEVAFGKMDERLLDYLDRKQTKGELASTHQEIANDLGTSREVVSRILKDFERKGIVRLSRNLIHVRLT